MTIPANKRPEFLEAFILGTTGAIAAVALWPISYVTAYSTEWLVQGRFLDVWLGAAAIVTGLGAVVATATAVLGLASAVFVLNK